jgi:hypothetical protein
MNTEQVGSIDTVESVESAVPVLVPAGNWELVGSMDGPYYMTDDLLRARYIVP